MNKQVQPPSEPLAAFREQAESRGETRNGLLLRYGELLLGQGPRKLLEGLAAEDVFDFVRERFAFVAQRQRAPFGLRLSEFNAGRGEWATAWCLFDIVLDDRPFLIDSIRAYFSAYSIRVHAVFHPVVCVRRTAEGRMTEAGEFQPSAHNEAHMTFVTDPLPEAQRQPVLEALREILQDVIFCVDDFPATTQRIEALRAQAGKSESARFVGRLLEWCEQAHFVFMGYLPFAASEGQGDLHARQQDGLGLFNPRVERNTNHEALLSQVGRMINMHAKDQPLFVVEETNILARVHRRTRLSAILCAPTRRGKRYEAAALVGVFTHRSLREDVMGIPVVSDKVQSAMRERGLVPGSHTYKEVLDYFNGMPRFELFRLSHDTLAGMIDFLLSIADQPRMEILLREELPENTWRVIVTTPVADFPHDKLRHIRERIETLLSRTAQNVYLVELSHSTIVNIVFQSFAEWRAGMPAPGVIEEAIGEELQTREERLMRLWLNAGGAGDERMARSLIAALPEDYQVGHADAEIMADLARLSTLIREGKPQFELRESNDSPEVKAVLYGSERVSLSRIMPVFSNLRVHVVEEKSFEVVLHARTLYLHTFLLRPPAGYRLRRELHEGLLRELIFNILAQGLGEEPLHALLITCGFRWRQINLMCLYRNYLLQVGTVYTRNTINETLIARPQVARALFGVFEARLNPALAHPEPVRKAAAEELDDAEREIDNLTEDRIVQALRNLVRATVRTNFYQDSENPVVAVKLDSRLIDGLPAPRPLFEIYVCAPLMEGIHLRGDMIARGGLRYSDRPDDFRTEVLGLMATQMKKNALIVPLGSKGGFVVKNLTPYGGDARAAGDDQYRVYVRALLSLTDNLVRGQVVPPPRTVRHDVDDPYLVVAADKGTAHLSDTANAIAQEMGFWLDDAFASGGSHGYDHKQVGITALGAWESVKRHFWERGIDVQHQPVTVVGIGDMSGDVFGNGMLCSRSLRLVGAFDHRHIFIDPDPDPAVAYRERERLFALPRSSWLDYDPSKLSPGGGVFPRNAKEIRLSPQAARLLGTTQSAMSGEELIRTLLALDVDLLWNGGIGTYIKSRAESHLDVGDPNNNAVRIDAESVRAKVIGEGGNLGLTQQARIEIDLHGGSLISDAVDNAGGVNMSDHEVNLKILLHTLIEGGRLPDREARNTLLAELTDSVTGAVVRANFRQVMVIAMDRLRSRENVNPFLRLIDVLATQGSLDRRTEALPNAQRFQQFQNEGTGIPRPVLSVLLAYTKMLLYRRLVDAKLLDDPFCRPCFAAYFPAELAQRLPIADCEHPLRRNIIATVMTNRVIDQAGMTFIAETASLTDRSWPELARAYMIADSIADGPGFREEIYALSTSMPAEQQYELLMRLEALLASMTRWMLVQGTDEAPVQSPDELREALSDYGSNLPGLLDADAREIVAGQTEALLELGMQPRCARLAAQMPYLDNFLFVHTSAVRHDMTQGEAYSLAALMDEQFMLGRLSQVLLQARYADNWEKQFGDKQKNLLTLVQRAKFNAILAHRSAGTGPLQWMEAYLGTRQAPWKAYQDTARRMFAMESPGLVAIAVVVRQLELL